MKTFPSTEMCELVGVEAASHLRDLTLRVYKKAADYARQRGIIIADTKFEFGRTAQGHHSGGRSSDSGFFPLLARRQYDPGQPQDSYDKQYVRDYLEEIHWNKQPPAPALPADVARAPAKSTSRRISSSRDASWMCKRTSGAAQVHGMPL